MFRGKAQKKTKSSSISVPLFASAWATPHYLLPEAMPQLVVGDLTERASLIKKNDNFFLLNHLRIIYLPFIYMCFFMYLIAIDLMLIRVAYELGKISWFSCWPCELPEMILQFFGWKGHG